MKVLGIQLRQPALSDLPMVAFTLAVGAVLIGICMLALRWDIGQASAIIYGFTATAIATACGVDFREHGFRGLLVAVLVMVALVATTVGIHLMLK